MAAAEASTSASTSASSLTPALFRSLHPRPYLDKFLSEGIRPDGRPLGNTEPWRELGINVGSVSTAPASCLVRLGKTSVVCGLTLEVAPTELSSPNCGFIVPNVDLSPLCSPLFRPGAPPDEAQVLSARLRDILISSNILPLEDLVIEPGKAAFVVYLDVVCLNYDGGVLDAAVLSCVGALRSLTLPQAEFDIDTLSTICYPISSTHPGRKPNLNAPPLTISFSILSSFILPDPTLFESDLSSTELSITLKLSQGAEKGKLVAVQQKGDALLDGVETLRECLRMAEQRAKELLHSLG